MAYIYGVIGATADTAVTRTDNEGYAFALGDVAWGSDGSAWVYVQASGAITGSGYSCVIDEDWQAAMATVTTTASAFGQLVGVPATDFADDDYGWLQVFGVCEVQVAASAAANLTLNSTATGGTLDDNDLSGSEEINGLILTTARAASAGTAPALLTWPTVGATI